ncbi:NADP-dependent isocitrate dehydrogenase [bacterium]|nr:isocitrate dehydrogenase (NADP(+)) [Chloroflexi bacterium CFX6]RIL05692.1 MAG: NADP-dependent isocitrate dehydrogenase [bacterium]
MAFETLTIPADGQPITGAGGRLAVPDRPIIPFILGDGIGVDVTPAMRAVLDAAVAKAYGGGRSIAWVEVLAGDRAQAARGEWLPAETLEAFAHFRVGIKGPLSTPVGGGIRSLNVAIRQTLDLYANVRPVYYIPGLPSPVKTPEAMDIVLFREATEDVYAGIEWKAGTPEARKVIDFLKREMGVTALDDQDADVTGVGIKPIGERKTKRLVRKAIDYALARGRKSVTLVHKGNIMKFTEGAFRDWGYQVAAAEYGDRTVTEADVWDKHGGQAPAGRVVMMDRIADNMLQQILLRTGDYDVLALPNLNGDYLSDAAAAQVGGLGIAHGGNIGDDVAVFEAVHGTAPKYAGQDKVNPTALILSGVMMLEHLGWDEAAARVRAGVAAAIADGVVTYDLARQRADAREVRCSAFAAAVIERM